MAYSPRANVLYHSDILNADFLMTEPSVFTGEGNAFGWLAPAAEAGKIPKKPGRLRPRHVIGASAAGRTRRAICATTGCDLWTGAAHGWNDAVGEAFVVTGYVGEAASVRTY